MRIHPTELPDVVEIEPRVFADPRGWFLETFQSDRYAEAGLPGRFVQDNLSRSRRGVVRGLHFQRRRPQGKLIQVIRGAIFDVAVDVRRGSPTFGRFVTRVLSDENRRQLWIPVGFAHGFLVLSETADVVYKCTDLYFPEHERTLLWNDPAVGIPWPSDSTSPEGPLLSPKDAAGTPLAELDAFD